MVQANVIYTAHTHCMQKLLFLGLSCIYPKLAQQPMLEDALLTDLLEPTNEPYAIAKIACIKLCENYSRQYGRDYLSVMPTNLYSPSDNYDLENSHVIPALIRRFHEAKANAAPEVVIWGIGTRRREFLYVDDMAEAKVFVKQLPISVYTSNTQPMRSHVNVGFGFDPTKPDAVSQKWMDSSRINGLGWQPKVALSSWLQLAYSDMPDQIGN